MFDLATLEKPSFNRENLLFVPLCIFKKYIPSFLFFLKNCFIMCNFSLLEINLRQENRVLFTDSLFSYRLYPPYFPCFQPRICYEIDKLVFSLKYYKETKHELASNLFRYKWIIYSQPIKRWQNGAWKWPYLFIKRLTTVSLKTLPDPLWISRYPCFCFW